MRRLTLNAACLLVAMILAATIAVEAHARPASPVPDEYASDCGWQDNGQTKDMGGGKLYTCHCARLTGPNGPQVICRWYREPIATKHKPAKHKLVNRYGIAKGVIA